MLTQIRSFLAVAQEGSLTRAADRLRMSQPALTRQVQALEDEAGGRLLERSSVGVKLTAAGHALVQRLGGVLQSYDDAMLEVRRLARGESDQLRIGYMPSAACEHFTRAIERVRERHPGAHVKLLDLSPGEQIAALREGRIDFGLTSEGSELLSRDFYTKRLTVVPSYVAVSVGHPLAGKTQIGIRELRRETFVTPAEEEVPGGTRRLLAFCRKYGNFKPRALVRVKSAMEGMEMVANENAVVVGPAYMRNARHPGVKVLPLKERDLAWELVAVWQRGRTGGPLKTLVEAMTETVGATKDA